MTTKPKYRVLKGTEKNTFYYNISGHHNKFAEIVIKIKNDDVKIYSFIIHNDHFNIDLSKCEFTKNSFQNIDDAIDYTLESVRKTLHDTLGIFL